MPSKYNLSSSTVQNRYLGSGGFKGVDFTSAPSFVSPDRFSDAKNVYIDYQSGLGACVETFPGYRNPLRFAVYKTSSDGIPTPVEIHGMVVWHVNGSESITLNGVTHSIADEDVVAIHAGQRLYIVPIRSIEGVPWNPIVYASGTQNYNFVDFPRDALNDNNGYKSVMTGTDTLADVFCVSFGDEGTTSGFDQFVSRYSFLPDKPCKMFAENGDLFILAEDAYYRVILKRGSFTADDKASRYLFKAEEVIKRESLIFDPEQPPITHYSGGYTPTTYINNEEYEQQNLIGDSFSELFTEPEVTESEDDFGGESTFIENYRACTVYPSSKMHFFAEADATFAVARIAIEIDGKKIFDSENPNGGSVYGNLNVGFYNKGEKIIAWDWTERGDAYAWFDEVRISQTTHVYEGGTLESGQVDILRAGSEIRITAYGQSYVPSAITDDLGGKPVEAILGCKVIEHHDGRIFFAGNPKLPNVVFYTQRNLNGKNEPTYIGVNNYFRVGGESTAIRSMTSTSSTLILFKDAGRYRSESSIYYATGVATENDVLPRIYTVTQGAIGVGCTSEAINFADDICFASERGIFGLNKLQTNLERSVMSRSTLIDGRLASEDPEVLVAEWEGYLCVLCKSGHMYLADSRQLSSAGYEWFYVDKVGFWDGQRRVTPMEDIEVNKAGLTVYDSADREVANAEVSMGSLLPDIYSGHLRQYITETEYVKIPIRYCLKASNRKPCVVIVSGEVTGGTFCPATTMLSVGKSLWFGANGALLILNSDLRGLPNGSDDEGIDPMRLRSKWYTFCGRRYESYVTTYYDDAGIPNLAKSTINRSTIIDLKTIPGSAFKVSVYTERDKWNTPAASSASIPDYGDTDFSLMTFGGDFHTIIMLREHTNRWARKMYRIYSDEYCKPFGIHRISYQFRVAGRIKDL